MFLFAIAFLLGDLYMQSLAHLPPQEWTVLFLFICAVITFFAYKRVRFAYLLVAFSLGLWWTVLQAHIILAWTLPHELEGKPITMVGRIASIPSIYQQQSKFIFALDSMQGYHRGARIQLTWRNSNKRLVVGEKWRLHVRIKRIHGTQNLGGFDYEAWAMQKNLRANGYVIPQENNQLLAHASYHYGMHRLRQIVLNRIQKNLPSTPTAPWLLALIVGERANIPPAYWQVLRNTGTNHLMAVAGLHIGLMAGFAHFIVSWCWRRFPCLIFYFPAQMAGACGALVVGMVYSALAGFSIPTQRACFMLCLFISALLLRKKINPWHAWSAALLGTLILNPLAVLTDSLWLSFGTIALIIYGMSGRVAAHGLWWKWGRVQWVIGLGLIPFSLLFFQDCSLISFVANTIAIPWLGFLILPFCLLSTIFLFIFPPLGVALIEIADKSLALLWRLLTWFAQVHFSTWQHAIPQAEIFFTTTIACLLFLIPRGAPARYLGLVWLMPLIFYHAPVPPRGDYWLTLLDVGQGLSAVVQTHAHTLVFDAGAKYGAMDMGENIVLPYLHHQQINRIDRLVISHGDNDHAGGAEALVNAFAVSTIHSSVPDELTFPATTCLAGISWQWDGVSFAFLHPSPAQLDLGNNSSCVLRVENGKQRVLIPGDIEKLAEKTLLSNYSQQLPATVLIAPHHGSKTSALKEFVAAVHPRYVLYATGYRNRYHFPHASVQEKYTAIDATQLNTATTGAITFKMEKNQAEVRPQLYREQYPHYWY